MEGGWLFGFDERLDFLSVANPVLWRGIGFQYFPDTDNSAKSDYI
ncbi:MAG: hypothetical protein ACI85I_001083 [Arenicella sp.]|jgi:hypothetical protein